ncbi:hypothetical protein Bbelb_052660 [Branchiostoma belcheri]|nr:hypothetical protein Bbelb_052660 [Branchiostoma belcheri]
MSDVTEQHKTPLDKFSYLCALTADRLVCTEVRRGVMMWFRADTSMYNSHILSRAESKVTRDLVLYQITFRTPDTVSDNRREDVGVFEHEATASVRVGGVSQPTLRLQRRVLLTVPARTHDTVCECSADFYWDAETEQCERCQICPPGFGALEACSSRQDSGCVACPNMTYSDVDSPRAQCVPCTRCTDNQVMLQTCTSISDTICLDKNMPQLIGGKVGRTTPADGLLTLKDASGQNIIPVYCTIMGAVVVGLIVYVAVKRWKTCHRPQTTKSAAQPHDVEAQKHQNNDSGVCVDPCTSPTSGKTRVSELSAGRVRDLVFTLSLQHPVNWRHLATELGYDIAAIDEFEQGNNNGPGAAKAFLVHWSRMENATVDNLCEALRAIGRQDVTGLLQECNMGRHLV